MSYPLCPAGTPPLPSVGARTYPETPAGRTLSQSKPHDRYSGRQNRLRPVLAWVSFMLLAFSLSGCASLTKQVAGFLNQYDFLETRYEELCSVAAPPAECLAVYNDLHVFEKHLHGAAKALKNGGGMALQMKAVRADAKKLSGYGLLK